MNKTGIDKNKTGTITDNRKNTIVLIYQKNI